MVLGRALQIGAAGAARWALNVVYWKSGFGSNCRRLDDCTHE